MNETAITTPLDVARNTIRDMQFRALNLSIQLRKPPPEPTTCCGRGCNGCVWEGYYAAMVFWHEDAQQALVGHAIAQR